MSNSWGSWYKTVPDCFKNKKDYVEFVKQIRDDKPLTKLCELDNNREALKAIFRNWPFIIDGLKEDFSYWANYIDTTVYIVKNTDNEVIKNLKWEKIYGRSVLPVTNIKIFFALLLPDKVVNDTFYKYLDSFAMIIQCNTYWKERADTGIERLDGILNYLYDLAQEIPYQELRSNLEIQAFIISYLYLNDIRDYDIIRDFILNKDYYIEKMKLNNCYIIDQYNSYDYDNAELIFNNFDGIFNREKVLIK